MTHSMKRRKTHDDEGWHSPVCTKARCGKALEFGEGNQFLDEKGNQQRYCWKHWVEYTRNPVRFPGEAIKEGS